MSKARKLASNALTWLLCICLVIGWGGVSNLFLGADEAYAVNIGTNPTPKVDIAVSLPSDYQGTFLEFKKELTDRLIAEGMEAGTFRITDTAAKIDMSNTDGWYVYDHYRDDAAYNALNLSAEQKLKQPYRKSDAISGTAYTMEDAVKNNRYSTACLNTNTHIYANTDAEGRTSMVFAGYPKSAFTDYMIYPAPSDARRTFSFDINPAVINTHTLDSFGFWLNAGISGGKVKGYLLNFTSGLAPSLRYVENNADSTGWGTAPGTQIASIGSISWGPKNMVRLTVELSKDKVTVQYQPYDANKNPGEIVTLLRNQPLNDTGFNGFGPIACYKSHNCSALSMMNFLDLEMSYDSGAFDALKTVQYYEGAKQKYFINLATEDGDPQIPDETDQSYADGINRMNENEIFYLSNAEDGHVVHDTERDSEGHALSLGLGKNNGFIATTDDYVGEMAKYIAESFLNGKKFEPAPVESDIPLANFYMINAETKMQVMTVHQKHLANDNTSVKVNFFDKSKPGTLAKLDDGSEGSIAQWQFRVLDPKNNVKYDSGWKTDPAQIQDFVFDKNTQEMGKWIFELTVKDQKGHVSKASQTYVTVFMDELEPFIDGSNSSRNVARITLTDTGQGIDDDGITFIEDNRGSGIAAYWVTDDKNATPGENDWEYLETPVHQYDIEYTLEDTSPLVVWVKDECGNIGNKAVFQPTQVIVQDPDGNEIDNYIVIGEKPIIVLPDDDPKTDNEEEKFSGWTTDGGDPVTPGSQPTPTDNVIVIRPTFSTATANIIYLANGGTLAEGSTKVIDSYPVVSGNSILTKIEDHNIRPVREGYSFKGWKLIKASEDTDAAVSDLVDRDKGTTTASPAQLVSPDDKVAKLLLIDEEGNPKDPGNIVMQNYYLVAQWEIGNYAVNLDANGGTLSGSLRSFDDVKFGQNVGALSFPTEGRTIPKRNGYIFQGWSVASNNDASNMFVVANGQSATPVTAPTMPSHDITVYAVWTQDTNKFLVHFDSDGGSRVNDQAHLKASATHYEKFSKPSKPGYDFKGWYFVNEDGSLDSDGIQPATANVPLKASVDHTFKAQWEPRTDTEYTVDYYINSGEKDALGNDVYLKVNNKNITKTKTGTTESTVRVEAADMPDEITSDGKTFYWYNPESSHVVVNEDSTQTTVNNNVLEGVITGTPTLSLKLYYDRFFNVTVDKDASSTGDGTCTPALKQKEGTTPTVLWKAAEGSRVTRVIVNGVSRDDLLNATSYTVENPLESNVSVRVVFEKNSSTPTTPEQPVKPKPPVTQDTYFQIKTKVVGTLDQDAVTLTPTQSVKNGSDAEVAWSLQPNSRFTIESVIVDGTEQDAAAGKFDFQKVCNDHEVIVNVKPIPTMGGTDVTTPDKYTVTVNRYGGDGNVKTSQTMTVTAGEKVYPMWDATGSDEWEIANILVDGVDISSTLSTVTLQKMDKYTKAPFNKGINSNHVVDIYLAKPDKDNPVPKPSLPDYTDKEQFVTINTKLVGAEGDIKGSITGGAVVEKGSGNYDVSWALQASDSDMKLGQLEQGSDGLFYATQKDGVDVDPGDDSYVCYELEKVVVNGKEIEKDANGKLTVPTDADQEVEVHVRPVLHTVTIVKYGEGDVSSSKSVYHLGDYRNLKADPAEGSVLAKVVIDGETVWELPEEQIAAAPVVAAMSLIGSVETVKESIESSKAAVDESKDSSESNSSKGSDGSDTATSTEENKQKDTTADEAADEADSATSAGGGAEAEEENPAEADAEEAPEQSDVPEVSEASEGEAAPQVAAALSVEEPSARVASATIEDDATPQVDLFGMLLRTLFMPLTAEAVENGEFDPSDMDQTGIVKDHKIEVYFAKQATNEDGTPKETSDGKPVVNPLPPALHSVTATIVGGEGTIEGNAIVEDGGNATITIKPKDGYEIEKVVDAAGNEITPTDDNKIELSDVDADHSYTVMLKRTPVSGDNTPAPGDITPQITHEITASVQGGAGSISGEGPVANGGSRTVTWTPAEGETVKYVYVDGKPRPDLKDKDSITFDNVDDKHHVTVVFASNPTNIDTDGDGEPDVNVDTDGDDEPDVNVDTDDDGTPDINVDTDDDGEPDVNKDTDGDGKPDVNIVDTDGDGKPDPVDPKDPDSPKTPTTNVDTDGDGKPDVNIDNDGDGIPDTNIVDVDLDGKPDPVDPKDPEAPKPNVNIDTDGDGKPDLNVDTDGDGKPDLNIVDKDKDGIPDPVDPKADPAPKPDVNVDTDGDGKPDINIDTDGDGKPDKNIDTDGNGSYGPEDEGHPDHAQWLKDQEKKDDDKSGADGKSSSDDKGGKSDGDKTRLSQTGDQLMPLMATMALLAMASLVVAMGAGRRTRRAKAGKHAR